MVQVIHNPRIISAAGTPPKQIEEFIGSEVSGTDTLSIARMTSPPGWTEPGQIPEFDEYTLVLSGKLEIHTKDQVIIVLPGEAVIVPRGQWVRYATPEGASYIAVCSPAFTQERVHRDEGANV